MKQKNLFKSFLKFNGIMMLIGLLNGCNIDDLYSENTNNSIILNIDDVGFEKGETITRGAKAVSIGNFGVSASIYGTASTYTSAGCGSFFFNESAINGSPTSYYWPSSQNKLSFFAYYPYGSSAFTILSTANSTGAPTYSYTVPSAINNQLDIMTGQSVNILGGSSSPVNLTMKHRCAAICFSVTNIRPTAITVNSIGIEGVKYSGTLNEETWTLGNAVNSGSVNPFRLTSNLYVEAGETSNITGSLNIFLMLPQTLSASAKIRLTVDNEEYEAAITGSWTAGKQYNYSLTVTSDNNVIVNIDPVIEDWMPAPVDLSMVDNSGSTRETMTTANCYLVHAAGNYMLPLVYGNAIKDGAVNTVAFYPDKAGAVDSNSPRTTLGRFVNHISDGITGPWITKSGSGVNAGMALSATSAELLWQDRSGLITNVSVRGDYLLFTVGSFGDGNALIAVKNSYGTILWSWHIWATTETLENTTIVATGSHNYAVAPVNLGWVPTGGSGKQGYCPYYQWGRKDPFIPAAAYNSSANHAVYNIAGADITPATITTSSSGIQYVSSTYNSISYTIQYPITFYYNSTTKGPVNTTYYNMWDAQNSNTENVATPTKKTIYDPCPPGFCVPTGNLYYYIGDGRLRTMTTWDDTNKGAIWNENITGSELWFPAVGVRNSSNASLSDVGVQGNYWPSTPYSTSSVRQLYLTSSTWSANVTTKALGRSIRPVAEE